MKQTGALAKRRDLRERGGFSPWMWLLGVVPLIAGCAVGEYRMPYQDGILVLVAQDHETHSSPEASMYDMVAQNATPAEVVAAAAGVVRFIEDGNQEPTDDNNYVWIEHPQYSYQCDGEVCTEWTMYIHFAKDSVTGDAGLSVGDMVDAGDFLGFESNVGFSNPDGFVHLHWHVAALPPGVEPTFNGYYLDYVVDTEEHPELIPVVCVQGGPDVLEKNEIDTAAGCGGNRLLSSSSVQRGVDQVRGQLRHRSPIALALGRISEVSEEAVAIAQADPELLSRTVELLLKLRPAFEDLRHLGAARITTTDLESVRTLLLEYQTRGSARMHAALQPLHQTLANPAGAEGLGLVVWDPFDVLD